MGTQANGYTSFGYNYYVYVTKCNLITPRACARGKAIGLSVCCHRQHENRQISSFRRLCVL